ncbi:DUF2971 domain-containing protein [Pseudomonas putida]|uniref:DUF2971 domain-containing protein n=1 Tax=Pseudomonas putida TaxID=303 RepID=UPI0022650100|nr:DUF2971 domain-containing protein [Pseudomonas putida]
MKLFHYTDVNAVKSILENKKLWLTDVRFLNDSTEMKEGFEFLLGYLDYQAARFSDSEQLQVATSYVKQVVYQRESYGLDRRPVFISSFSLAEDLLSQWRAYGGYAIEFDSESMKDKLAKCIYSHDEKMYSAPMPALKCLLAIGKSIQDNAGNLDHEGQEALAEFIGLAATLKHRSFSEEQEYRLIMGHDVDPEIEDGYEVKFRGKGGLLVPYLEYSFELKCIKSIVVGPMRDQELAYASMKAFVKMICNNELVSHPTYFEDIEVSKSSIPFRP